ncbi:hypothetical protein N177_3394 [Lutibaculum baratangense AMV1]|uniref:Uncharacterized protein n=2 Tax=Lutibaculum TaxID=1358438 RepID=V4RAX0_9HYPH|nr:hypothetical protein N177_3394 [Lutibaculum baratangense AMV1]
MSITGHKNLAEVEAYTRDVNRRRLATEAMATIDDEWKETEPETKTG